MLSESVIMPSWPILKGRNAYASLKKLVQRRWPVSISKE